MRGEPTVKSNLANLRRAECDDRKRQAGQVRLSLWIDGEGAAAVEALARANGGDRGFVVSTAVRYMMKLAGEGMSHVNL
jgi:hypothetical protein